MCSNEETRNIITTASFWPVPEWNFPKIHRDFLRAPSLTIEPHSPVCLDSFLILFFYFFLLFNNELRWVCIEISFFFDFFIFFTVCRTELSSCVSWNCLFSLAHQTPFLTRPFLIPWAHSPSVMSLADTAGFSPRPTGLGNGDQSTVAPRLKTLAVHFLAVCCETGEGIQCTGLEFISPTFDRKRSSMGDGTIA